MLPFADVGATNLPTEALVAPPLRSQGFGGEGVAICSLSVRVATHRTVIRERDCRRCAGYKIGLRAMSSGRQIPT
jgi:hypothetical protein